MSKKRWINLKSTVEIIFLIAGLGFLTAFFITRDSFYGITALLAFQLVAMLWARQDACNNSTSHVEMCDVILTMAKIMQDEGKLDVKEKIEIVNDGRGLRIN